MRQASLTLVNEYARSVVSGETLAGEHVIAACQRHLDDLEHVKDDDYPYRFDKKLATRAINFIELLPHTKGRWAAKGENIVLQPWQRFIVGCIFGWVRKADGLRRFREVYAEIPRKNGKSVLAAAIGLYCLAADEEYGAEVYAGATTEKQAWEVFRPARLMARKTVPFLEHYGIEVNASNLLRLEDFSRFEPLIGNPGDGASPSCAIVDEFHEHKSPDLYDTMQTGMGAREQPIMLVITTAGTNIAGPCYEKRLEAIKVLRGVFEADRLFAILYTLDPEDDYKQPENWAKANPNIGISVSEDYLEAQVKASIRSPSKQSSVKTKHFNCWVGAKQAWINMEYWARAGDSSLKLADFQDESAHVGLDMATRIDIASRVSLFSRMIDGVRHFYAFPHFYLPEEALEEAKNAEIYRGWAEEGFIHLMDGAEIEFSEVQDDILALPEQLTLEELVYDPWQTTQLAQAVRKQGVEAVEYRNTVGNMSPPMKELEAALASGRFHHPDNAVFNWMASNIVAREDAKENVFPRKELPENKIDGIVALLFAMGRAIVAEDTASIYESEGMMFL